MSSRNLSVVDMDTGEDLSREYTLRNRKSDEGYRKQLDKEAYRLSTADKHWVASYHDPIDELSRVLTLTETGAIIKLLPYMQFKENGRLIKDGKSMNQTDVQRIFKRGKTATRLLLSTLEDTGVISVIKEGRSNVFYISARFHEKGNVRGSASFTKLYQVRTREVTDDLSLSEAGILYKILPYFHYDRFYLVANPDEPDIRKLRYLNRDELARLVGLNVSDISRTSTKLRRLGALMSTRSSDSVRYLVHPDVMYRQSKETEWAFVVRQLFDAHTDG